MNKQQVKRINCIESIGPYQKGLTYSVYIQIYPDGKRTIFNSNTHAGESGYKVFKNEDELNQYFEIITT